MGIFQKAKMWLVKKIFQKKSEGYMGKLFASISGYKTYITLVVGILVAVIGHFWGPLSLGGVEIPFISSEAMWQVIWAALTGVFLRQGVAKSGPTNA
jgi:hypothetical protein